MSYHPFGRKYFLPILATKEHESFLLPSIFCILSPFSIAVKFSIPNGSTIRCEGLSRAPVCDTDVGDAGTNTS